MPTIRQLCTLFAGCVVLGLGVGLLLTADLGADGYSTLITGLSIWSGLAWGAVSVVVALLFLLMAYVRGLVPGIGTVAQVAIVSTVVPLTMKVLETPQSLLGQVVMLALAFPLLASGIAGYLGSHTGAGPTEAAALAWDPPIPFKWSYSTVQFGGALVGWLGGATVGFGT
ncbi:MAG TPA: hypothetical protein PKX56_09990, partial [Marmoricola sp.]|nr:hypothetical protein [Marmoricola sp.]